MATGRAKYGDEDGKVAAELVEQRAEDLERGLLELLARLGGALLQEARKRMDDARRVLAHVQQPAQVAQRLQRQQPQRRRLLRAL